MSDRQSGTTFIEVLVALLVFTIGALAVALLQAKALKYSDSAMRSTQASFIAHDLLERIRANPQGDYALASLEQAPGMGNLSIPRDQDLFDFARQLRRMGGVDAGASVVVTGDSVTVSLDWNDARAEQKMDQMQRFTLTATVSPERGSQP